MPISKTSARGAGLFFAAFSISLIAAGDARTQQLPKETMDLGKTTYLDQCATCHGEVGEPSSGDVPRLAPNFKLRNDTPVIRQVLQGGPYMPGFSSLLSDAEVAAVLTYVRNSWGNAHGPVSENQVAATR